MKAKLIFENSFLFFYSFFLLAFDIKNNFFQYCCFSICVQTLLSPATTRLILYWIVIKQRRIVVVLQKFLGDWMT